MTTDTDTTSIMAPLTDDGSGRRRAAGAEPALTIGAGYPQLLQEVGTGEIAIGTRIELGGFQVVYADGTAQDSQVNAGLLSVWAGGLATGTVVNDLGTLQVAAGGMLQDATITAAGTLLLAAGAELSGTLTVAGTVAADGPLVADGLTIICDLTGRTGDDAPLMTDFSLFSGAAGLTLQVDNLQDTGVYAVLAGAAGLSIPMTLASAADPAASVAINPGQWARLGDRYYSAGVSGGELVLVVQPLLLDSHIIGAGYPQLLQEVRDGQTALGTRIELGGFQVVYAGGTAQDSQINAGLLSVWTGGQATGTLVNDRGTLQVAAAGQLHDATIAAGGMLLLAAGAELSGTLTVAGTVSAAGVLAADGLNILCDLTGHATSAPALIDNLAYFAGAAGLTLRVNAEQEAGIYALVSGATGFAAPITVITADLPAGRELAIGEFVTLGDRHYRLLTAAGNLTLEVQPLVAFDAPLITADNSAPTRFAVTLTVAFDDRTTQRQYSFDGDDWFDYSGGVAVSANGTVFFRSTDGRGNVAEGSFAVTNIDTAAPQLQGLPQAAVDAYAVTLSWQAAADNVGVTAYELKIGETTYELTSLEHSLTGLNVGDYIYALRASDAAGNWSGWSAGQTFTVADVTAPMLAGLPEAVVSAYTVTLSWQAAADNDQVAGYVLKINGVEYDVGNVLSHARDNLDPGAYAWQLAAYDRAGLRSEWSTMQSLSVLDVTAPVLDGLPAATVDGYTVTINWAPAVDNVILAGYQVMVGGQSYWLGSQDLSLNLTQLGVGEYAYRLQAFDGAGNISAWSAEQTFTVADVTAPVLSGDLTVVVDRPTGLVTLSWQAASDNIGVTAYEITLGGVSYLVTSGTGLAVPGLAYGRYTAVIRARDAAGNWSTPGAPVPFQVTDGFSPELSGNPAAAVEADTALISWDAATDNVGVTGYEVCLDGAISQTAATSLHVTDLAFGWHTYKIRALDADGNASFWSDELTFWVDDLVPPLLNGVPDVTLQTYDAVFSWPAAADNDQIAGYLLKINGQEYDLGLVLDYERANLLPGTYRWQLAAYDPAGHRSAWSAEQTFTVADVSDPVLAGLPAAVVDAYAVTLSWQAAADNVGVTAYELKVDGTVYALTSLEHVLDGLAVGEYAYALRARDAAGNWSSWSAEQTFTVADVTAPVLAGLPAAAVDAYAVTLSWQAAADNIGVTAYELKIDGTVYALTSLEHALDNLAVGEYAYALRARDAAGNYSAWSAAQTFTVADVTAPVLVGLPVAAVDGYAVTLSWQAAADNIGVTAYELKIDGTVYALTSLEHALDNLAVGEYAYALRARDAAGNWSGWSAGQTFTVADVTNPVLNGLPTASVAGQILHFSWTAAADNIGVAGYQLRLNGTDYILDPVTAWQSPALPPGNYTYLLRAFDDEGNVSAWSAPQQISVTDYAGEPAPGDIDGTLPLSLGELSLAPGSYHFTGEFAAGLNATITLVDRQTGKTAGKTTVKNGILQPLKNPLLLHGDYELFIASSDRGASGGAVAVALQGTQFILANQAQDDDPASAPTIAFSGTEPALQEWVGFGDVLDYRRLDLAHSGSYDFTLGALENPAQLTIFRLDPARGTLKALKKITVTPKFDRAGNWLDTGVISDLLLDQSETYYLQVVGTKAAKGQNTPYTLTIDGTPFNHPDSTLADNDWWAPDLPTLAAAPGTSLEDGWVGYGDAVDFRRLTLEHSGSYDFTLGALENPVQLTIYRLDPARGTLKSLKKISVTPKFDRAGNWLDSGVITGLLLDRAETYYLEVTAPKAAKGLSSAYTVTIGGTTFNHPDSTLADNDWLAPGLPTLAVPGGTLTDGWVGYGDAIDFRRLTLDYSGLYDVTLDGLTDKAKLTVYELNPERGTLKALKNVSVTPKFDRAGNWLDSGAITGLLLDRDKTYYLAVEATNAGKGGFTGYELQLGGTPFDQDVNPDDNAWDGSAVTWFDLAAGDALAADRWVGFGDPVDCFRFALDADQAGVWNFVLTPETAKAATMTVYRMVDGKLSKLRLRNGGADLAAGDYAVEIKSADAGKGKKNTAYDLAVFSPAPAGTPAPGTNQNGWLA